MSEQKEKEGCLVQVWPVCATVIVLSIIKESFGWAASAWFAGGFMVAAFIAFWEAGKKVLKEESDTPARKAPRKEV